LPEIAYIRILGMGLPQEGVTYFNICLPNTHHPTLDIFLKVSWNPFLIARDIAYIRILGVGLRQGGVIYLYFFFVQIVIPRVLH